MTNYSIINSAKAINGVFEEVDTFAGWNRRGKKIKAGSKALFKTSIWKPITRSNDDTNTEDCDKRPRMILVPASFFGISQVEPAK